MNLLSDPATLLSTAQNIPRRISNPSTVARGHLVVILTGYHIAILEDDPILRRMNFSPYITLLKMLTEYPVQPLETGQSSFSCDEVS